MKERLDILMTQQNLAESRERARALIMEGAVSVNGVRIDKAGAATDIHAVITVKDNALPFVSRGGLKLQKAVEVFPIELEGRVCADIGASTGGFTDCMLQHGAKHVYALDVGYGQLHWKLRNDGRVSVMERRNARFLEPDWFDEAPSFASIDVSFISLRLILPPLKTCLTRSGELVALIKPQFEAGRSEIGKNGVVREKKTHIAVVESVANFALETGYAVRGLDYSPITGPKGNIEFLLYLSTDPDSPPVFDGSLSDHILKTVELSHNSCIL